MKRSTSETGLSNNGIGYTVFSNNYDDVDSLREDVLVIF